MPIFLRHDTILKETYGEYFLAELIEAQDEENHAVVCEVGDLSAWVTLTKRNERNKHIASGFAPHPYSYHPLPASKARLASEL